MATDLGRAKSPPAGKYDALVAAQLAQAEKRIRLLDLTTGLLGLAALSLAYIVGMIVCDSQFVLAPSTRQLAFYVFLAGAIVYLYTAVIRPLQMRVNPYYAARQVEQQLPHAKNSIVNWVDLHEQVLPPAVRGALGQRAAKDLAHVDLDRAISGKHAAWAGGLAGLFAVAFIASFFLLGPKPFLSLLERTFNPFAASGISTRTQLILLKPEGGNATITVGRGVNFVVDVHGKIPNPRAADAVKLLYRYEESDPWLERRLVQEPSRDWSTSLSASEVKNGFWYKITGGDAETEEYQITIRAAPAITDFLATYHFRPYVARVDEIHRERELKTLRGTEILLSVRTNRALREGRLEFEGKDSAHTIVGQVDPHDPHHFLVRFALDENGRYRLGFSSLDNEAYRDSQSYPATAIPDKPPTVELTKPGKDIRLPADALLQLEGKAADDIGVKSLVLSMRVVGGETLREQPYRSTEELRLADGGYPVELEYRDFVELAQVKSKNGRPFSLRAGMELEYWLKASDACDHPRANVTESKHYRVILTEPEKAPQKQKQEKQQAENSQKQHEKKQDQKLQKENQDRQQQRQEQQTRNEEEKNKSESGNKENQGAAGNQAQDKKGEQGKDGDKKDNEQQGGQGKNSGSKDGSKQQGENKNGQGERQGEKKNGQGEQKSGQSDEDQKIEERIKKALENQQSGKNSSGENKGERNEKGEGKGSQANNPDGGEKPKGERNGTGQQGGTKNEAGKAQPKAGGDPTKSEGKGDDQPRPAPGEKRQPKDGDAKKPTGQSADGKGEPETLPHPDKEKTSGDPQANKQSGSGKPEPAGQEKAPGKGERKPSEDKARQQTGGDKQKGNSSASKNTGDRKDAGNEEQKQGNSAAKSEGARQDDGKQTAGKGSDDKQQAKSESGSDAASQRRNATPKDVQDLARKLESKNAREREQAKQQLQRIEKEAADPDAREKAGEALKKAGEPDGSSDKGTPKKNDKSSGKPQGEGKKEEKNKNTNDADSSGNQGDEKGQGKKPGEKNGQNAEKNGQGAPSNSGSEGSQQTPGGNTPGGGANRRRGGNSSDLEKTPPSQARQEKPRDHRAAQMQLEDFAKKVNKDILKDAGVSEEAWKRYLASKRQQLTQPDKPRPEGPSVPSQAKPLPNMGGKTIEPAASGTGDTQDPNHGKPPPGYRDAFRKFTQQMSKDK